MSRPYRAVWSVLILVCLVAGMLILPNTSLFAGKSGNPFLNKAAVGADTPFIVLGMGCFWGSEKRMQSLNGVLDVEAGYAGGDVSNPSYETLHETEQAIDAGKVLKNHAEVVKVYFDPKTTTLEQVLIQFWENHNPTQGNRQGNDVGSNYRSAVFYRTDEERLLVEKTKAVYQSNLKASGNAEAITTEIAPLKNYTPAEEYHQDYLDKNPLGYCGLGGTGVAYDDSALGGKHHATPLANKLLVGEDWANAKLNNAEQLIAFEAVECGYCRKFDQDVLTKWNHPVAIYPTNSTTPPPDWKLKSSLFATPTIVLFRNREEVARYTGYQGADKFWQWLEVESSKKPR
jgi:peptide methionine sulfoxide reductase msrA/msrB